MSSGKLSNNQLNLDFWTLILLKIMQMHKKAQLLSTVVYLSGVVLEMEWK